MMENGKMTVQMEKGILNGQMEIFIKVTGQTIKKMEKDVIQK